jgi:hypothetical protein
MHAISLHLVLHAFEGTLMWCELNFNKTKPNRPLIEPQCIAPGQGRSVEQLQEREKRASESAWFFYSLEPSTIDGTRSSVDPRPQCIGAGSIHALNISNQQRPIHCSRRNHMASFASLKKQAKTLFWLFFLWEKNTISAEKTSRKRRLISRLKKTLTWTHP